MSITAYASQLGIPINRRFPMTLTGGASLERLGIQRFTKSSRADTLLFSCFISSISTRILLSVDMRMKDRRGKVQ
jgi:hypothetical protein